MFIIRNDGIFWDSRLEPHVECGTTPLGQHNISTGHGRRQSRKEFNAYLASEAKNGNHLPIVLWLVVLCIICGVVLAVRGY
ncbi:hypothetical protein B6J11_14765 [Klebsiella pneumoniae]|nr:hypothetical protein B6J11_14765 [Klebsiella pneumoniae]